MQFPCPVMPFFQSGGQFQTVSFQAFETKQKIVLLWSFLNASVKHMQQNVRSVSKEE